MKTINGVVPVMLTPFTADDQIDYPALAKLIDWYLAKGVDALFAPYTGICLPHSAQKEAAPPTREAPQ